MASLKPAVRIVRDAPDVEFPGSRDRTFSIEWATDQTEEWDVPTCEEQERSQGAPTENTTIRHYERTIQALAVNAQAAEAFLDRVKGRQRRAGHSKDGQDV
jgi:hypothetical protein